MSDRRIWKQEERKWESWAENDGAGGRGKRDPCRKGKTDTSTRCETEDTEMSFVLTQRVTLITESQMQFLNTFYHAITSDFSTLLFLWPRNCPTEEVLLRVDVTILDLLDNCTDLKGLG